MRVIAIFLVAVVLTAQAISFTDLVVEEWNTFKAQHKKEYESDIEEKFRMRIFMENKLMIVKHNAKYEMGIVSYKLEINEFADMLHHEFINIMNGFNDTNPGQLQSDETLDGAEFIEPANVELPKTVDWREKGAVTPVKNQKRCGSCWSFSATGSLEGQHFRKTGVLTSLSEQNLIDCSSKYGNHGCRGGSTKSAFKYIRDNKGLDTENSYPYEGQDDVCRYDPSHIGAKDVGFVGISRGNENKLKSAVATVGPISVSIDAHRRTFQFYSKGVYYDPECSSTKLNHAVLAVGYGTDEKGQDYWLVKNSWGKGWGDKGYIKMARNKKNHCGIATRASYPLV